jgi:hypothetical protein
MMSVNVTIGSVGRSFGVDPSIISCEKGNSKASSNSPDLSLADISSIESSGKTDNQIEEAQLDLFLNNVFLALEDTDKNIELMQESIDANKKDIRAMLDRIKELVVDAR